MSERLDRRTFLKGSLAASAGASVHLVPEERILMDHLAKADDAATPGAAKSGGEALPTGKIKDVTFSRVICGGNLIGGWAHSRDLMYVSRLFKAYNTEEKIMDTLELCEEHGINAILTNPVSGPVINRYWRERGGKIQWICEAHPKVDDLKNGISETIDNGAAAMYIQGGVADTWHKQGRSEQLAQTVEHIKEFGIPGGIGAHSLDVLIDVEAAGGDPDFYVKTLHTKDYWSAQREEQTHDVISNRADNYWCVEPDKTIQFMKERDKPWIAFKTLAAGAIPPKKGFTYAFENGADFICVGMFDFQIAEDAAIARDVLGAVEAKRERPWRA